MLNDCSSQSRRPVPRGFGQLPRNMSPGAAGGCPAPAHSHCMLCQSALEASPTAGCPLLPFPHTVHRADVASPRSGRTLGRPVPSTEPTPHEGYGLPTHALTKSKSTLLVSARRWGFLELRGGPGLGTSLIPRPSFEGRSLSGQGQLQS